MKSCSAKDDPFSYCDLCHTPFIDTALLDEHKKRCGDAMNSLNRDQTYADRNVHKVGSENNLAKLVDHKSKRENDAENNTQENNALPLPEDSPDQSSKDDRVVPPSTGSNGSLDKNFIGIVDDSAHSKDTVSGKIGKGSKSCPLENQRQSYNCERCNKQFKLCWTLKRHLKLSLKENSVKDCKKCNMKFCLVHDYNKHEFFHMTESKDGKFVCPKCGKILKSQRLLSRHFQLAEKQSSVNICEVCNKEICLPKDFERHKAIHNRPSVFKCDICGKEFKTAPSLSQHKTSHREANLKCHICGKLFNTTRYLKRHLDTHADERKYKCNICEKSFKTKPVLRGHLQSHGINAVSHECDLCGKNFQSKFKLDSHKVGVHKQDGKFRCSICGKCFAVRQRLQKHFLRHTGERPISCDLCGKSFKDKPHWNEHKRSAHGIDIRYQCTYCERGFYSKSLFDQHTRFHLGIKPYTCDECGKSFVMKSGLERHMRCHTGETPYQCEICKKQLKDQSSYKLHLRVHSGEKPYECNICKKRFTSSGNRNKHSKVHREENKGESSSVDLGSLTFEF